MISKRMFSAVTAAVFVTGLLFAGPLANLSASASNGDEFEADLNGYQEVPAVSTSGEGKFKAELDGDDELKYKVSYEDLEGEIKQIHLHFAQEGVNGGVIVFLCTNMGNDPTGLAPECPSGDGKVKGTLTAKNILGPEAQGIEAGEFDEFVDALRAEAVYVNVHTDKFPSGELRGQVEEDQEKASLDNG